jgi:hypothetical protein
MNLSTTRLSHFNWSAVEKTLHILSLAALGISLAYLLIYSAFAVHYRYQLAYGEPLQVHYARQVVEGRGLYQPISGYPYVVTNYTPLYVLLLVPFVKLGGPSFAYGRVISFLAALATGGCVGVITWSQTRDRLAALFSGLLFLTVPFIFRWASLTRSDMVALFFTLAGLVVILRWPEQWLGIVGGATLMVIGVYAHHAFVLAASLAGLGWLFSRNRRLALLFVAVFGGLGLSLFFLLSWMSDGGFFFHTVLSGTNPLTIHMVLWGMRQLWRTVPILLLLVPVYFLWASWQRRIPLLIGLYTVGGAIAAIKLFRVGSNVNHVFELTVALCLVAGAMIAQWRVKAKEKGRVPPAWVRIGVWIMLIAQIALLGYWNVRRGQVLWQYYRDEDVTRQLEAIVVAEPGLVLGDNQLGLLVLNSRDIFFQPDTFTRLSIEGKWDASPFLADIRARRFGLIVMEDPPGTKGRWTDEMLDAILANYESVNVLDGSIVFRPKSDLLRPDDQ